MKRYGPIRRNPWRKSLALVEKSYGARRTGTKPAEECSLNRINPTAGGALARPSLLLADHRLNSMGQLSSDPDPAAGPGLHSPVAWCGSRRPGRDGAPPHTPSRPGSPGLPSDVRKGADGAAGERGSPRDRGAFPRGPNPPCSGLNGASLPPCACHPSPLWGLQTPSAPGALPRNPVLGIADHLWPASL